MTFIAWLLLSSFTQFSHSHRKKIKFQEQFFFNFAYLSVTSFCCCCCCGCCCCCFLGFPIPINSCASCTFRSYPDRVLTFFPLGFPLTIGICYMCFIQFHLSPIIPRNHSHLFSSCLDFELPINLCYVCFSSFLLFRYTSYPDNTMFQVLSVGGGTRNVFSNFLFSPFQIHFLP